MNLPIPLLSPHFGQISQYCPQLSDMPSAAIPFPFGECKICNDKATGVHYGVTTCEGCKGFFKRSITKGEKYKCFFGGQCILSPQNRNRCKSCRYKRCLEAGMSIEAVKMGRIPKIDKERALEEHRRKEEDKIRTALPGVDSRSNSGFGLNESWNGTSDMVSSTMISDTYNPDLYSRSPSSSHRRINTGSGSGFYSTDAMKELINQMTEGGNESTVPQAMWKKFMMSMVSGQQAGRANHGNVPQNSHTEGSVRRGGISRSCAMYSQVNQSMNPTSTTLDTPYDSTCPPLKRSTLSFPNDEISPMKQQRSIYRRGMDIPISAKGDTSESFSKGSFDMDISSTVSSYSDIHNDVFNDSNNDLFENNSPLAPRHKTETGTVIKSIDKTLNMHNHEHNSHDLDVTTCSYTNSQNSKSQPNINSSLVDSTVNSQEMAPSMDLFDHDIKNEFEQYLFSDEADMLLNGTMLDNTKIFSDDTKIDRTYEDLENGKEAETWSNNSANDENDNSNSVPDMKVGEDDEGKLQKTIRSLVEAEKRHNADTKRQLQQMWDEIEGKENIHPWNKVLKSSNELVKQVWDQLFASIPECNARILGFCRSVPGFCDLCAEDQEILMQNAYSDIWLITCAPLFHNGDSFMRFPNGARYSRWWMRKFLPDNLINDMHNFCQQLNECSPTNSEIAIICAVRLTAPDRPGLSDRIMVKSLHSHLLDVLAYEVSNNHKLNAGRILIDIMRILPMLSAISDEQARIIGNFKIEELQGRLEKTSVE